MDALEFLRALWAVDHGLHIASKRMHARIGVTGPQRVAIRLIGRRPGISASELAEGLLIDPSTLTGILRRLEEGGYVRRDVDRVDRRRARLVLTGLGEQIDAVEHGTIEAAVRATLATVDPAQLSATAAILSTLAQELAGR